MDKFYTTESFSKICIDKVFNIYNIEDFDLIIEPSAGNGSFYNQIISNNKLGLDIEPENDNIILQDFFDYIPPENKHNILTIGNPPFGKVCSVAIKFFNHASKYSNVIAFIIPKTFRKVSLQNKLNHNFHLIYDLDVPLKPCSFIPKIQAKCCFQIWERKENNRDIIKLPTTHKDWDFLKNYNNADFAIRRVGGLNVGELITDDLKNLSQSYYWIKSVIDKDILIKKFNSLNYIGAENTTRHNSIGKAELIALYNKLN